MAINGEVGKSLNLIRRGFNKRGVGKCPRLLSMGWAFIDGSGEKDIMCIG